MSSTVHWDIEVSEETDQDLRNLLGVQHAEGHKLSQFVEGIVRSELFFRTVDGIQRRNADVDPDELQAEIDEAVREVRQKRAARRG